MNASKIVEQHYVKSAIPVIPSLNDRESHPLDNEVYSVDLRKAIQIIKGACVQLMATVVQPSQMIMNVSDNFMQCSSSLFF